MRARQLFTVSFLSQCCCAVPHTRVIKMCIYAPPTLTYTRTFVVNITIIYFSPSPKHYHNNNNNSMKVAMATCTYDGVQTVVVAVGTTSFLVRITTTSTINVLTISKTNLFNECVWVEGIGWNKRHIPMTLGLHVW